jgi:hypothetical protein
MMSQKDASAPQQLRAVSPNPGERMLTRWLIFIEVSGVSGTLLPICLCSGQRIVADPLPRNGKARYGPFHYPSHLDREDIELRLMISFLISAPVKHPVLSVPELRGIVSTQRSQSAHH